MRITRVRVSSSVAMSILPFNFQRPLDACYNTNLLSSKFLASPEAVQKGAIDSILCARVRVYASQFSRFDRFGRCCV
nr:MAG TPA: hypothetical protein [Caudoviricetes sp.]